MKKNLLTLLFSGLAILSVHAELVWNEGFNYADGLITNNSAGIWKIHSSSGPNDAFVRNKRAEISGNSSTNASRQADFNRPFYTAAGGNATNGAQILYASFTINCTNLPTTISNYIAHFFVNTSTFYGRVHSAMGALPGTWRLGLSAGTTPLNKIYPVDLARDTDYQVVIGWNPTGGTVDGIASQGARLWVNPISSSDPQIDSTDAGGSLAAVAFALRQAGGTTSFFAAISNLTVATTFDEAATNAWITNAVAPAIVRSPASVTNFTGDNVLLFGIAAGQGLGSLTYTWLKSADGVTTNTFANPNGNTNTLNFPTSIATDSGYYQLVATTPYGLSATSTVARLWVTNAPVPPTITVQPVTNVTGFFNGSVTLTLTATGPNPIDYTWVKNGTTVVSGPNATADFTISGLQATDAGNYRCGVSNIYGGVLSSNVVLIVTNPPAVSIAYLRTLVEQSTFSPTNSTSLWEATGTISTFTNLTSVNTASYYLQDSTAGINIFITLGSSFRPAQGDIVKFVGVLSSFNGQLELYADGNDPTLYPHSILSNNVALLPVPRTIPVALTNTINTAYIRTNLEASIVMLTNVFFGTNAGTLTSSNANTTVVVTNSSGQTFGILFASQQSSDVGNVALPEFAYTVAGPLTFNSGVNLNGGLQVTVTRFSDVVTNALMITNTHAGNSSTLTWDAAPLTYSYSAWAATAVTGPYVLLTNKLRFIDASGTFTDTSAGGSQKYYRLTTP